MSTWNGVSREEAQVLAGPRPVSPSGRGEVFLVGAGPGDPELLTIRAWRCLQRAEVVLYDRLLDPRLLDEIPPGTERLFVGKAPGRPGVGQEGIHRLLVDRARRGLRVVRLKGGDPYVFGRGGEEGIALDAAGIPWQVVPGISSALAVPALAGIPLTHRAVARSFTVVTAHRAGRDVEKDPTDWDALARIDTVVVLMGVASLPWIVGQMLRRRAPETPAAMVERGTLADERRLVTTLGELVDRAEEVAMASPSVLVVGEVVRLAKTLAGATASQPLPLPDPHAVGRSWTASEDREFAWREVDHRRAV